MSLRLFRRVPIIPGVRLNLTGRGMSISFGHKGLWYTLNRHGRRATLGWPGSGLGYTTYTSTARPRQAVPPAPSAVWGLVWLAVIAVVLWVLLR